MTEMHLLEAAGIALAALNELGLLFSPFIFRLFPRSKKEEPRNGFAMERIAVIVCAHNEESTIGNLLTILEKQMRPADSVIVIADNCADNTAAIARSMGAVVLEKEPTEEGGKADALKFFLDKFRHENFDGFVFFDADTIPNDVFLENIITGLKEADMAVGCHSFENVSATWAEAGNSMLGHVMWHYYLEPRFKKNVHTLVMGMGYGLRRSCLDQLQWTPRTRTEDLALSLDTALADAQFVLCSEAQFRDKQPESWFVSWHRMRRWMTGDLQCLHYYGLPLLARVFRGDLIKLDFLLFLLAVPTFILKAFGLLCLAAAACCGKWQLLALLLGFDLAVSCFAVLTQPKRRRLQFFSIPALYCLYLQLPWIALSTLFLPPKQWVPGREAPCAYLRKEKCVLTGKD